MIEQEDPELTSFHGHTRITTIYRATTDEKDLKTSRKDIPQLKIKRINHNKTGSRDRGIIQSRTTPSGRQPVNKMIITTAEILPKEQGVHSPDQGSCTRKTTPGTSGFEGQWDLLFGDPESCWNKEPVPKSSTQKLTHCKTQARSSNMKGVVVRHIC